MSNFQIIKFFKDKTVLVIDDCPMILNATRAMLIKNGSNPDNINTAKDARQAITACTATKYDFILCDYNLGHGTDGLQLLEQLRINNGLAEKTVVFVVTGEVSKDVFFGFSELEPDGYLLKPININAVTNRLVNAYRQKQVIRSIYQTYRNEGAEAAFKKCARYESSTNIQLVRANILQQEEAFEQAQQAYISLINSGEDIARIHLGKMLVEQEKYELALKVVNPVIEEKKLRFKALQVQARCFLKTRNTTKCLEVCQQLNSMSSTSVERLLVMYNLALAADDSQLLLNLTNKISSRITNSRWFTADHILIGARTYLELAEREQNPAAREVHLGEFKKRIKAVEQSLKLSQYQWQRDMLKARYAMLTGDLMLAEEIWFAYQQDDEAQQISFYCSLDAMHLGNRLGGVAEMMTDDLGEDIEISQEILTEQLAVLHRQNQASLKRLTKQAIELQQANETMKAVLQWIKIWQIKPFEPDTAFHLIRSLSHSIPMNMPLANVRFMFEQAKKTIELKISEDDIPQWFNGTSNGVEKSFNALAMEQC
ncbi:response regulator [Thalassotalea euphylliae]|uniref:response regulator n=1 Tax=Thalassotalea euphylliae TaxID=1655234 RepID=UPI003625B30A